MNGTTESMVKAIKKALKTTIGIQVLKFSELLTVLYECLELVNRRPIGKLPSDVDEEKYLCPNDLILGRSSSVAPRGLFSENARLQKRFQFIQSIVDQFWTSNFFPTLLPRQKWHHLKRNMKVGDVVIIKDSNSLRDEWKIGRITKVLPSDDGVVRRVIVLRPTKFLLQNGLYQTREIERAVRNLIAIASTGEES